MPDVTGSNFTYNRYVLDTFKGGVHQPESDALKMGLLRSTYVPDEAHVDLSNVVADELVGNGYSRQTLTNVVIAEVSGWITMQFDEVNFGATGGPLQAKYWFMFNDTPGNEPLIAGGQIDVSRDDEIVLLDGKTLDIVVNELGLYRVPA